MSSVVSPLTLLCEVAPRFGATLDPSCTPAIARVPVFRSSGARYDFILQVEVREYVVTAREAAGGQLPSFCPDRHINSDGSFCLGWGPTSPSTVADPASAERWWIMVIRFLRLQVTADETRKWINGNNDWAHGDAAEHQARAEAAAEALGQRFKMDLQNGAFSVTREAHRRGDRIALTRNGAPVARIILGPPARLKDTTIVCPCGGTDVAPILQCDDHAEHLATFTAELWHWQEKERAFARRLVRAGSRCCETLDRCVLRDATTAIAKQKKDKEAHARRHRPRRRPRL